MNADATPTEATPLDPGKAGDLLAQVLGDGMTASDAGRHFTCGEADLMAIALLLLGQHQAAVTWITGHAEGDDCGDTHHGISHHVPALGEDGSCAGGCTQHDTWEAQTPKATAYLAALTRS